jgi:hypothetical protein
MKILEVIERRVKEQGIPELQPPEKQQEPSSLRKGLDVLGNIFTGLSKSAMVVMLAVVTPNKVSICVSAVPVTLVIAMYIARWSASVTVRSGEVKFTTASFDTPADSNVNANCGVIPPINASCLIRPTGDPN